jgi:hypothetical protein
MVPGLRDELEEYLENVLAMMEEHVEKSERMLLLLRGDPRAKGVPTGHVENQIG